MAIVGLILALGGTAVALARSRAAGGYYESEVYAMTAITHRRFATVSLVFAGAFAVLGAFPTIVPVFPVLAAYVLLAILYATSFARGAQEEDEP